LLISVANLDILEEGFQFGPVVSWRPIKEGHNLLLNIVIVVWSQKSTKNMKLRL